MVRNQRIEKQARAAQRNGKQARAAESLQGASGSSWLLPYTGGLVVVLLGFGLHLAVQPLRAVHAEPSPIPGAAKCWSDLHAARAAMRNSPVISSETFPAWARRHGIDLSALGSSITSRAKLRKGGIGGLELGSEEVQRAGMILRIPASHALFEQSHSSFHEPWDLTCLQLADDHEKMMAGLVLSLLAELHLGSNSSWSPYLEQLPKFEDFRIHPLLSPREELDRFEGLELADYFSQQHQEVVRGTFSALSERPKTCLGAAAKVASYTEYLWARLLAETRARQVDICGTEHAAIIPVYDSVNTGLPGSYNTELSSSIVDGNFHLQAKGHVSSGQELVGHYKRAPNDELAATWGFVLQGNPVPMDRLPKKACERLRHAECVVDGCLFAVLRDEACGWL